MLKSGTLSGPVITSPEMEEKDMESSNLVREKLMDTPSAPAERRRDSAEFRRVQIDQVKANVHARLYEHRERRQQFIKERAQPQTHWPAIQVEIRAKLKEISIKAAKLRQVSKSRERAVAVSATASSVVASEPLLVKSAGTGSS